jgi:hypothetical protein
MLLNCRTGGDFPHRLHPSVFVPEHVEQFAETLALSRIHTRMVQHDPRGLASRGCGG